MNSEERRKEIIQTFRSGKLPVSGGSLADMFGVSRQIIVQDIALLRAQGNDIISTNRNAPLWATPYFMIQWGDMTSRAAIKNHY